MLRIKGKIPAEVKKRFQQSYKDCCAKQSELINIPIVVKFNSRLKVSAGRASKEATDKHHIIEINPKYYDQFGIDRIDGTFRHEIAHVVCYELYKDRYHSMQFKKLCVVFDGTMNKQMAGDKFTNNGTNDYIKSSYKWHYECPDCNNSFRRKRKISDKKIWSCVCTKCKCPAFKFIIRKLR